MIDPAQLDSLRGMVAASVGYVSNWFLIFRDVPYVDRFGPPLPLDVYVGSSVDLPARVERMMSAIGDQPVIWLTAKSLVGGGAYANDNMRRWNEALLDACGRYPNMRVYDWASDVKDKWFIEDGIHYTSDGYEARAHKIARALAAAFPAGSEARDPSCVVG